MGKGGREMRQGNELVVGGGGLWPGGGRGSTGLGNVGGVRE